MRKANIAIAVVVVFGVVAALIAVAATGGKETRKFVERLDPWESPDGMIDESKLPATMGVGDSTGAVVGYLKRSDEAFGLYPLPVYGADGRQIGQVGENGYWALGEAEPYIPDSYTGIQEWDADGNLIYHQIIYPEPPPGAPEGPTGNTD